MSIERIEQVPVRDVWRHEAYDFTTWLEENIDVLNDNLVYEIDPDSLRREAAAGAFSVDLVGEDMNGQSVVIENQLERSDHDHLGKVLTYTAAFDADIAIWIVADARPEHVRAVGWLNDSSQLTAYLFKIQAIKIADSPPAPLLTLIVGPSESAKAVASSKQETSRRAAARGNFFAALLEYQGAHTNLKSNRSGSTSSYMDLGRIEKGVALAYGVTQEETSLYIWIERGKEWGGWNDAVFENLKERRDEIEEAFGESLTWEAKEGNRSRKLITHMNHGGWKNPANWDEVIKNTVEKMVRFDAVIRIPVNDAVKAADATVNRSE